MTKAIIHPPRPIGALPVRRPGARGPRFSVITICLNDRANLERTAASVMAQKDAGFEWIVVDGGSQDGTSEFLAGLDLPYLQWTSEKDRGLYDAMNKGAARAGGEFLLFLNAGDLLVAEDTLARIDAALGVRPRAAIYYGDSFEEDAEGRLYLKPARSHRTIWYNIFTYHQSILYARRCFHHHAYDPELKVTGDFAFTAALLKDGFTAERLAFPVSRFLRGGISDRRYFKGKLEGFGVRRRLLGMPLPVCAAILAAQAASRAFRLALPFLYARLRYAEIRSAPSQGEAGRAPGP